MAFEQCLHRYCICCYYCYVLIIYILISENIGRLGLFIVEDIFIFYPSFRLHLRIRLRLISVFLIGIR